MSQAIENHVGAHVIKELDSEKAKIEADRIEELLITQLFEKVSAE